MKHFDAFYRIPAHWAHLCILHGGLIYIAFCPSVCPSVCHWIKIHNWESIIDRSLKLYHNIIGRSTWPFLCVTDYTQKNLCQQIGMELLLWQVGLIANVKLHFLSLLWLYRIFIKIWGIMQLPNMQTKIIVHRKGGHFSRGHTLLIDVHGSARMLGQDWHTNLLDQTNLQKFCLIALAWNCPLYGFFHRYCLWWRGWIIYHIALHYNFGRVKILNKTWNLLAVI